MKTKRTNKQLLVVGIKTMGFTLVFLILAPVIIRFAIINQEKPLYIPLIILGILTGMLAIYFGFRGINIIMDSLFKKEVFK